MFHGISMCTLFVNSNLSDGNRDDRCCHVLIKEFHKARLVSYSFDLAGQYFLCCTHNG